MALAARFSKNGRQKKRSPRMPPRMPILPLHPDSLRLVQFIGRLGWRRSSKTMKQLS